MKIVYSNQHLIDMCYDLIKEITDHELSKINPNGRGSAKTYITRDVLNETKERIDLICKPIYDQVYNLQLTSRIYFIKEK